MLKNFKNFLLALTIGAAMVSCGGATETKEEEKKDSTETKTEEPAEKKEEAPADTAKSAEDTTKKAEEKPADAKGEKK